MRVTISLISKAWNRNLFSVKVFEQTKEIVSMAFEAKINNVCDWNVLIFFDLILKRNQNLAGNSMKSLMSFT